jgi:molecular chaperone DnaJ
MPKDYYKTLGIDKNATEDQIKKAFRKLAHEHHPDKSNGKDEKFKEINEAYQVLSNKEKRQKYDQFGSADFNSGFGGAGGFNNASWQDFSQGFGGFNGQNTNFDFGDLGDIFGDIFGTSSRSSTRKRSARGKDIEISIEIYFKEAIFGVEKIVHLKKNIKCEKCGGIGGHGTKTCPKCKGSGKIHVQQNTFFGSFASVAECPDCDGSGQILKDTCDKCNANGYYTGTEEIKIKIPAGIDNGQSLRLEGKGEPGKKSKASGDLYVRIKVLGSNEFQRDGYDIKSTVKVKYSQLILGDKITVRTVDGDVKLKIPSSTSSEKVFILKDKGVPKLNSRSRGDHFVKVVLDMPNSLSHEQKKLIDELSKKGL